MNVISLFKLQASPHLTRVFGKKSAVLLLLSFFLFSFSFCQATNSSKPYFLLGYPYPPGSVAKAPAGLFSTFRYVIGALHTYDENLDTMSGLEIDFGTEGLYYDPLYGSNSWEYYCEPIRLGVPNYSNLKTWEDLPHNPATYGVFLTTRDAPHRIIQKYIKVKPHILEKVAQIRDKEFSGFMIGIHYRGTDKYTEATPISYSKAYMAVINLVVSLGLNDYKIYVATDEAPFIDFMKAFFPNKIVCYEECTRSFDNQPVHFNKNNSPYKNGEDAFIDCLLLAQCDYLLATLSHLSICSSFFNPYIPMVFLNDYVR